MKALRRTMICHVIQKGSIQEWTKLTDVECLIEIKLGTATSS